jgi:hypothetical protein
MRAAISILIVTMLVTSARAQEPAPAPAPQPPAEDKPADDGKPPLPSDTLPAPPAHTATTPSTSPFDTFTGSNEHGRALFDEAKGLLRGGDQTAACAKFADSYKQEEAISTQLNLARCRENEGNYGEAYRMFEDAARRSREAGIEDRAKIASDAAAALDERLATVVVKLAEPVVPGTTVFVNDRLVETAPEIREKVDPGNVVVEAKGPTGVTARQAFRIFPQNTMKVEVPTLEERRAGRQPIAIAGSAVLVGGGAIALGAGSGAVRLVGGVSVAGGIALFLLAPKKRVMAVPALVSNETPGVALVGRF